MRQINRIEQDGDDAIVRVIGDTPRIVFSGTEASGTDRSIGEDRGDGRVKDETQSDPSTIHFNRPHSTLDVLPTRVTGIDSSVNGVVERADFHFSLPQSIIDSTEQLYLESARTDVGNTKHEVSIEIYDVDAGSVAGENGSPASYRLGKRYNRYINSEQYVRTFNMSKYLDGNTNYRVQLKNRRTTNSSNTFEWRGARLVMY